MRGGDQDHRGHRARRSSRPRDADRRRPSRAIRRHGEAARGDRRRPRPRCHAGHRARAGPEDEKAGVGARRRHDPDGVRARSAPPARGSLLERHPDPGPAHDLPRAARRRARHSRRCAHDDRWGRLSMNGQMYRREFLRRSALAAASAAIFACAPTATTTSASASLKPVKGGTLTWGQWDKITTPDDKTVVFSFKQPYPAFMLQIWRYFFGVLSPKYLATLKPGDVAAEPVGSGPFMFAGRSSDGVVTIKANPDYSWPTELFRNRAAPYLDQIKFRAITEPSTRVATLESGENLFIDEIPEADYARLKDDKRFRFVMSPRASHTLGFSMNVSRPPTDDRAVREAVNWAVDRKSIVDKIFFGVHHVSVGPLSEGVWARDDTLERSFTFDPAKAKQLLDQAGWKLGSGPVRQKGGQNLEIALATFRSPWTEIAQAMQSQLRDVGIDLKVQVMDRGPYLDYVRGYKHNMAATSSTSIDPDGILRVCYHSANRVSGSNFANLNDPQLDALLTKGQGQDLNTAERKQTYVDAQKRVMEILPFVGVMSQIRVEAMATKVHDFRPGPDGLTGTAMNDAWVEG